MDSTPFKTELALTAKNNESINVIFNLRQTLEDGTDAPVNLTGRVFRAQARTGKSKTAPLICDITVAIEGDPADGKLRLSVPASVISTLQPVRGFYDVLIRVGASTETDNLWMAPFTIEEGVSQWT